MMEYVPLDTNLWREKPVDPNRVVNKFDMAASYLKQVFKGWEFGFFTEEDIEDRRAVEGYIVMTPDHFKEAKQTYNAEVALRFGFREKDGAIWLGDVIVCARPTDWSERRRKRVQNESEARYAMARYGKALEIQHTIGKGVQLGASVVDTTSTTAPQNFTEGSQGEDESVYTNAEKLAKQAAASVSMEKFESKERKPRRTAGG